MLIRKLSNIDVNIKYDLLSSPDQAHLVQALQAELDEECGQEGEIHLGLRLPLLRATILEVVVT